MSRNKKKIKFNLFHSANNYQLEMTIGYVQTHTICFNCFIYNIVIFYRSSLSKSFVLLTVCINIAFWCPAKSLFSFSMLFQRMHSNSEWVRYIFLFFRCYSDMTQFILVFLLNFGFLVNSVINQLYIVLTHFSFYKEQRQIFLLCSFTLCAWLTFQRIS